MGEQHRNQQPQFGHLANQHCQGSKFYQRGPLVYLIYEPDAYQYITRSKYRPCSALGQHGL